MEPPFDGAGAFAEDSGDVRNAFSVKVVQDDGFPVVFRKKRDLAAEEIFGFPAGDFLLDAVGGNDILGEVDRAAGLFLTQAFEEEIVRHAPAERAEAVDGLTAAEDFEKFEDDVLREVFGFLAGIHAEAAEAEDFVEVVGFEKPEDVGFRHGRWGSFRVRCGIDPFRELSTGMGNSVGKFFGIFRFL